MVKNRILTSSRREIKRSFPRFFSLLMMSFLGVFVYSGLKATPKDMMSTLSSYLNENKVYDIKLTSSIGFNESDIDIIKSNLANVNVVETSNYLDLSFKGKNDNDYVIELISLPKDINICSSSYDVSSLKEDEILVESHFLSKTGYKIDDEITFVSDDLNVKTFTIKGDISSPLYFSNAELNSNHGKTNIGTGTINFYGYINNSSFNYSYFKNIYIRLNESSNYETNSTKYNEIIDSTKTKVEKLTDKLLESRKEDLNETLSTLNDVKELLDKKEEVDSSKNELNTLIKSIFGDSIDIDIFYNNYKDIYSKYPVSKEIYENIIKIKEYESNYLKAIEELNKEGIEVNDLSTFIDNLSSSIESSKLYINDRLDDSTYKSYIDDSSSIDNLALIFPLVFYFVAILVSLVSMNRMVDDDRLVIGTLKSLGFNNHHIIRKYIDFAFYAVFIGSILGVALGIYIIPTMINSIYKILFDLPYFKISLNYFDSLIGFLLALIAILGSTLFSVYRSLKENPASLLRAKAPKKGKRVLLERWKWFWNKIKFSNKVTIRNISRYKKRVIVTIIGVAGCTALMLTGFGIRDSITDIPSKQFEYVTTYDAQIYFNNIDKEKVDELLRVEEIESYDYLSLLSGTSDKYDITLNVLENKNDEFIHFYDVNTEKEVELNENEVLISDKLAQLLKLNKGDNISFNIDDIDYEIRVGGVIKNYINHYIFISESTYTSMSNKEFIVNSSYLKLKEMNEDEKEEFQLNMLKNDEILNIQFLDEMIDKVDDMLQSLNKVVIILIVLAAFLAFVVLYNLSSLNIHERRREIATLKVLGFYPKEVDRYITLENIILTIVGIILGLILGYFLCNIVVSTVEIEYVRFIHKIKPLSFIYSGILSLIFTLIVNLIAHFTLKKIDMIESLKSVE